MNRFVVIQAVIDSVKAETYLEIGVESGKIIDNIKCQNRIGVDPDFRFPIDRRIRKALGLTNFKTFKETSDDFFIKHAKNNLKAGIDVAFIDGLHTYDQSFKDVENCLEYLNDGGVIIMHDCNPLNVAGAWPAKESIDEVKVLARKGEIPGWNNNWNGDVWKAVVHLRLAHEDLEIFTLDLDWGLGIVSKSKPTASFENKFSTEKLKELDYSFLEKDRVNLLNLRPPKYLPEFLETIKK